MSLQVSRVHRIVRTLCSGSPTSTACTASRNTVAGFSAPLQRQPHQRRQSSSKTSISPDVTPTASPQHGSTDETPAKASSSRITRRRSKNSSALASKDKESTPVGLPIVPPTNHLNQHDVGLSSFYSQHRPISLSASTPPQTSPNAFDKLFEKKSRNSTIDVVDTLTHAVQIYEDRAKVLEANGVRFEIRETAADQNRQPDRNPFQQEFRSMSLEEYVARFRPYVAPPPPEPMQAAERPAKRNAASKRQKSVADTAENIPRQTSYKTTILVTESVHANGQKTYTASTSPLEEVHSSPNAKVIPPEEAKRDPSRQPFLERMRIRQRKLDEFRQGRHRGLYGKMLLISVKRQRKLKMKKHKYKKLMKRTRNLRRKLDRN
ncbi:hypothetical protein EV356DRAFT_508531 [Viridothelium virens]|uniref:Small ribosomal subunit protein mS38 n=1 Tax=Viridothelium virens TaxID=1048519 RepID=A0A6A6HIJ9_VIRVR|nr:hypothetical protein EV356DRAFT_508531 [Viridothelium virens]